MVVLPLPVGPVTRRIPVGRAMNSWNFGKSWGESPSSSMPLSRISGSKMRRTAFSPKAVGMVLTRSSTSSFSQLNGWPPVPVSATASSTVIAASEALAATLSRCSTPLRSFTRIMSSTESRAKGWVPGVYSASVRECPAVRTPAAAVDPPLALDAPVLRAALLREVGAAEQLDAGDDRLVDDLGDLVHLVQHAVDAEADQR